MILITKTSDQTRQRGCMYVCMYVRMYVCVYVCTYTYVCMYICMYDVYVYMCVRMYVFIYLCMYGHHIQQSMDQPVKVANPARGQLNREINFPVHVRA